MNRKLNILYLSHYFPPEVNAPAVRVSALSKHWSKSGHRVTVITGFPNHPTGIIPPQYHGKLFQEEDYNGVRVLRSYVYATANKGFLKRILNYLSFMFSSVFAALLKAGKQDIVIATSPQFFVAVAGYIVSRIKRIPFVFEVRDVWPEEIVAVGAMKRGIVIRLLEQIEMFLYRKASMIIAVARGTKEILVQRGIPADKITVIPNGVDLSPFLNRKESHAIRNQYDLNGHFLVSYIGTHGMAHNLVTVLKAAEKLKENNRIKFLFVGDGADKENLQRFTSDLALDNVRFAPQQSREDVPSYYATSDLCLVPLRRAKLFTRNIPSKIYEIMAAGKPILIGTEGESQELVEQANAGLSFEPENYSDLAEKIVKLQHDSRLAGTLGANGRKYVRRHRSTTRIAAEYLHLLEQATS